MSGVQRPTRAIAGSPAGCINSDTTFVSSTTIAAVSIELRRLAHRFTRRQFEFYSAEGSKALANETCQVPGFGLPVDGFPQDQSHFLLHGTTVPRRAGPKPKPHIVVEIADRDARHLIPCPCRKLRLLDDCDVIKPRRLPLLHGRQPWDRGATARVIYRQQPAPPPKRMVTSRWTCSESPSAGPRPVQRARARQTEGSTRSRRSRRAPCRRPGRAASTARPVRRVPAEERGHGESVPEIMRAGKVTGRGPDAGPPEECSHGTAEAAAAVAASARTAMPEERAVRLGRQSPPAANRDQVLDLVGGIRRHRDEARLVELGFPDRQRALRRVIVSNGQPRQLSASQPGGGQHHDREAHISRDRAANWRCGPTCARRPATGGSDCP